jgi:hypothetical protein
MNGSQAIAHCGSERLPASGGGLPSASWALAMTEARRSRIIAYPSPGFTAASALLLVGAVYRPAIVRRQRRRESRRPTVVVP